MYLWILKKLYYCNPINHLVFLVVCIENKNSYSTRRNRKWFQDVIRVPYLPYSGKPKISVFHSSEDGFSQFFGLLLIEDGGFTVILSFTRLKMGFLTFFSHFLGFHILIRYSLCCYNLIRYSLCCYNLILYYLCCTNLIRYSLCCNNLKEDRSAKWKAQ